MGFPITPVHSILPPKKNLIRLWRIFHNVLHRPQNFPLGDESWTTQRRVCLYDINQNTPGIFKRASLWNSHAFHSLVFRGHEVWSRKTPTLRTEKKFTVLEKTQHGFRFAGKLPFFKRRYIFECFFFPLSCYFPGVYVYINTYINISSGQITMTPKAE